MMCLYFVVSDPVHFLTKFFYCVIFFFLEPDKRRPSYAALWGDDSNGIVNGHLGETVITPPLPEVFFF